MRKALAAGLVCLLALAAVFPAALAQEEQAWNGDELLTPGIFSIDGTYCEEGMNAPYESGYAPLVEDGMLTVVLPLLASRHIDGDVIYCGLDLGSRDNSPFQYQNYQSIPVPRQTADSDAPEDDPALYVAKFVLPLAQNRRNGVYPLGVAIRFRSGNKEQEQLFNIDFTVTDAAGSPDEPDSPGTDPGISDPGGSAPGYDDPGYSDPGYSDPGGSSGSDGSAGSAPPSEPKVILESAVASPSPAQAGEPFTVTCTLRNTSKQQRVSNMTVSYKSQTTDLIPLGGASTQYIEAIAAGATVQFAFQMESRLDAQSGPQKIDLSLGYDGPEGATYTASDEITVQIQQAIRLEYDQPSFPSMVYIGDSMNATLNLFNKGKGTLYNVTVSLDVPGIEPESSSFVGNMESGTSKSADIYASVTGLEPQEEPALEQEKEETVSAEEVFAQAAGIAPEEEAAEEESKAIFAEEVMGAADFELSSGTGETSGHFLVTYEDEFGTAGELHIPVSTDIAAMEFPEEPIMEPEEPTDDDSLPWWGWTIIGGGAAAAVAIPVVRRRRRRRAEALAAELDDDELL